MPKNTINNRINSHMRDTILVWLCQIHITRFRWFTTKLFTINLFTITNSEHTSYVSIAISFIVNVNRNTLIRPVSSLNGWVSSSPTIRISRHDYNCVRKSNFVCLLFFVRTMFEIGIRFRMWISNHYFRLNRHPCAPVGTSKSKPIIRFDVLIPVPIGCTDNGMCTIHISRNPFCLFISFY